MSRIRIIGCFAMLAAAWATADARAQDRSPTSDDAVVVWDESEGTPTALTSPAGTLDCRPQNIARGEISYRHYGELGYLGEDLIIRSQVAWAAFWQSHVAGITPAPPAPPIDFHQQIVLAVIQGTQRSGGGPNITIAGLECGAGLCRIIVIDDETPGPLDVITNPYHIVAVNRHCLPCEQSLSFTHVAPQPGASLVQGRVWSVEPNSDQPPRPLPGALVTLSASAANAPQYQALSGYDGSYVIANVAPRGYLGRASRAGYEPATASVNVPPDSIVRQDFTLTHIPPRGGVRGRTFEGGNAGAVAPLPGVLVRVLRQGAVLAQTTSNAEGRYELGNITPGECRLVGTKDGYLAAEMTITIVAGQTIERNLVLQRAPVPTPTGNLTGIVAGIHDNISTPRPIGGAVVRIRRADSNQVIREAVTNDAGHYAIEGLPVGSYTGEASAAGWQSLTRTFTIQSGQTTTLWFILQPQQP